jgi:hypothetical protein
MPRAGVTCQTRRQDLWTERSREGQELTPLPLGDLGNVAKLIPRPRARALLSLRAALHAGRATYAAVSLVLITTALLACWLPARRATRIPPVEALAAE